MTLFRIFAFITISFVFLSNYGLWSTFFVFANEETPESPLADAKIDDPMMNDNDLKSLMDSLEGMKDMFKGNDGGLGGLNDILGGGDMGNIFSMLLKGMNGFGDMGMGDMGMGMGMGDMGMGDFGDLGSMPEFFKAPPKKKPLTMEEMIHSQSIFLDSPENTFVSGKNQKLAVLVSNESRRRINVHAISGSFWAPDYSTLYRNVTTNKYAVQVQPGDQYTLTFNIKPEMEPTKLALLLQLDFTDDLTSSVYRVVSYNNTVHIQSPSDTYFDMEAIFLYIFGLLALAGIISLMKHTILKKSSKSSKKTTTGTSPVSTSSPPPENNGSWTPLSASDCSNSEWIPDHHLDKKSLKQRLRKT